MAEHGLDSGPGAAHRRDRGCRAAGGDRAGAFGDAADVHGQGWRAVLIKFFRNGQGGGSGPVDYLVERDVVAYDQNRNAIRDERGDVMLFAREPLPEVLHR